MLYFLFSCSNVASNQIIIYSFSLLDLSVCVFFQEFPKVLTCCANVVLAEGCRKNRGLRAFIRPYLQHHFMSAGSWGAYVYACLLSTTSVASTTQAEASRKEEAHPSVVLQLGRIVGLCKPQPVMVWSGIAIAFHCHGHWCCLKFLITARDGIKSNYSNQVNLRETLKPASHAHRKCDQEEMPILSVPTHLFPVIL